MIATQACAQLIFVRKEYGGLYASFPFDQTYTLSYNGPSILYADVSSLRDAYSLS